MRTTEPDFVWRKKPIEIEAWNFARNNRQPVWLQNAFISGTIWYQGGDEPYLTVKTTEGEMRANPGDWIIRGVEGELYPCKNSVFEATYERVPYAYPEITKDNA